MLSLHLVGSGDSVDDNGWQRCFLLRLARVVRRRRHALGLTPSCVTKQAKITATALAALEMGQWDIDILSLASVARSIQIDVSELLVQLQEEEIE